jgi:iron complex transport system substrate-binding protein
MSVYRVFTDTLETLRPEVIITQSQCEICAVSLKDVEAAVCELIACKPQIVSLEPMSLADVWSDIRKVAAALAVPETGETAIAALQARLNAISQTAGQLTRRPRIATIEWIDPVMAGGNWMPELVTLAGGENLFGTPGEHSPWVSLEEIAVADPEMLVVLPCGFGIERSLQEMDALERNPVWQTLRAVQQHQVYITDGNHYFNRPGPRLVESVEILAEILHPGVFNFGHRGTGWVPYQPALSAR